MVKAGDIIAKIKVVPDMVNLNSSESRVHLAKLAYEQSLSVFNRDKALFEKQVISKEEFEKSTLSLNNSKEELKTAQDNLSLVREGISSRTAAYSNTLVRSTITGTILDVPIKVGNSVTMSNNFNDGTTIATVANMSDMLFVGKLDETEIGRIHTGMPMTITIGALQEHKLDANLEYIVVDDWKARMWAVGRRLAPLRGCGPAPGWARRARSAISLRSRKRRSGRAARSIISPMSAMRQSVRR